MMPELDTGIQGWMGLDELQWLYKTALDMNVIVEIGSWMGRSTRALLSTGRSIVAIDHFKGSASQINDVHAWAATHDLYAAFKLNVGHYPNLLVMKMDSAKAASFFKDRSIDMVFHDGDHEYQMFKRDFEAWRPKCKKLICGHDRGENGVPAVLDEIPELVTINLPGSLWSVTV